MRTLEREKEKRCPTREMSSSGVRKAQDKEMGEKESQKGGRRERDRLSMHTWWRCRGVGLGVYAFHIRLSLPACKQKDVPGSDDSAKGRGRKLTAKSASACSFLLG